MAEMQNAEWSFGHVPFFLFSMKRLLTYICVQITKSSILVGGQAVMEGVMMRVPGAYATAVRDPKGQIQTNRHEFISLVDKYPILKNLPPL